jgi:NDP-sugar pyrophosphorylase family protein
VAARLGLTVDLSLETAPLGTAGALIQARAALDEAFLLVNGDTWFEFDWRELADEAIAPITVALRRIDVADRYETVVMEEDRIVRFAPRTGGQAPGLINGGAYRMLRSALPAGAGPMSLETQLLPEAAAAGSLAGRVFEGAFIDIGLPETLDSAQGLLAD